MVVCISMANVKKSFKQAFLTRRAFLKKGGVCLGFPLSVAASNFLLSSCQPVHEFFSAKERKRLNPKQKDLIQSSLRGYFSKQSLYKEIGMMFSKSIPEEADSSFLLNEISPLDNERDKWDRNDKNIKYIKQKLDQKIRMDFKKNNLVYIDQWLLSKTEVRIAALNFLNP